MAPWRRAETLVGGRKEVRAMAKPCDSCVGMGVIRREGETPKKDTWDRCADCGGKGETPRKRRRPRRRRMTDKRAMRRLSRVVWR